jgi:hypothetical protein
MIILANLAPFLGGGPKWNLAIASFGNCNTMWWKNIFFITIYYHDDTCMPWAWYLDNDIQIFVVGVAIMYIYCFLNKTLGKLLIIACILGSQIAGLVYTL